MDIYILNGVGFTVTENILLSFTIFFDLIFVFNLSLLYNDWFEISVVVWYVLFTMHGECYD